MAFLKKLFGGVGNGTGNQETAVRSETVNTTELALRDREQTTQRINLFASQIRQLVATGLTDEMKGYLMVDNHPVDGISQIVSKTDGDPFEIDIRDVNVYINPTYSKSEATQSVGIRGHLKPTEGRDTTLVYTQERDHVVHAGEKPRYRETVQLNREKVHYTVRYNFDPDKMTSTFYDLGIIDQSDPKVTRRTILKLGEKPNQSTQVGVSLENRDQRFSVNCATEYSSSGERKIAPKIGTTQDKGKFLDTVPEFQGDSFTLKSYYANQRSFTLSEFDPQQITRNLDQVLPANAELEKTDQIFGIR